MDSNQKVNAVIFKYFTEKKSYDILFFIYTSTKTI